MESQQMDVLYGNYEESKTLYSVVGWPEFINGWNGQDSNVARGGQDVKSKKGVS